MTDLIARSVKRSKTALTRTDALLGLACVTCLYVPPSTGFPLRLELCSKVLNEACSPVGWDPGRPADENGAGKRPNGHLFGLDWTSIWELIMIQLQVLAGERARVLSDDAV